MRWKDEATTMPERRDIDERDIDRLLAALTDIQIAAVFGLTENEVFRLRQSRQRIPGQELNTQDPKDRSKP